VMHVSGTNLYVLLVEDDYQDDKDNFYFEGVRTEFDNSIRRLDHRSICFKYVYGIKTTVYFTHKHNLNVFRTQLCRFASDPDAKLCFG